MLVDAEAAELHKLLLYEHGGHFKSHADTEKVPGMFATLDAQLPSDFTGGAFVVRHRGAQRTFVADESHPGVPPSSAATFLTMPTA